VGQTVVAVAEALEVCILLVVGVGGKQICQVNIDLVMCAQI
jgi:hypothetical protein